jgi:glycosyltransferase involved in cell wall biosynthesis
MYGTKLTSGNQVTSQVGHSQDGGCRSLDDLITVIIPVRNGERFIGRTLESVLDQTHRELEIIVVDDGSTDGTLSIIKEMASRDNRITYFSGPSVGVAAARNCALSHARGSFVAPVDADDLWHKDKLALQLDAIRRAGPKIGVVYCWSVSIDEADDICSRNVNKFSFEGNVLNALLEANFLGNASTPLIRREYLQLVGGYSDPGFNAAEDWKLYLMLADICEFALVPRCLVGYRRSAASVSANFTNMQRAIDLVRQWARQKWPSVPETHWRRQRYFTNHQLASLALRRDSIGKAMMFHLCSIAAWPPAATYLSTTRLNVRFLARLMGMRTSSRGFNHTPETFQKFSEQFNRQVRFPQRRKYLTSFLERLQRRQAA